MTLSVPTACRRTRAALLTAAAGAALVLASAACAAPATYKIDIAHSEVNFGVQCFGFFKYRGRFSRFNGDVSLDPNHWETLKLSINIPVDSLDSRPRLWRRALLGPEFFDSAHYPSIEFGAMNASRTGLTSAEATGKLTIRGTTRPLRLTIVAAPDAEAIEVNTETTLKRSDFGLGGVLPFASDDVTVFLRLRLLPEPPPRAAAVDR
jgi:polyisoprenoid-binding protein YceI